MNTEMFANPYVLVVLYLWELIWKGVGLYKSAQNKKKVWFISIFLLNTVGILPITYLVFETYNVGEKIQKFFQKYTKKINLPKVKLPKVKLAKVKIKK